MQPIISFDISTRKDSTLKVYKVIFLFYAIFIIYGLYISAISNLSASYYLPAIFAIILCSIFFWCGSILKIMKPQHNIIKFVVVRQENAHLMHRQYALLSLFFMMLSLGYVKFYTGMSAVDVFDNLIAHTSNYYQYQNYAMANNIANMSIMGKLHWVVAGGAIFSYTLYMYVKIIIIDKFHIFLKIFYLLLASLPIIYKGCGRGTNIELFFIMLLIIYCVSKKFQITSNGKKKSITFMKLCYVLIVNGVVMLSVFLLVRSFRGVELFPYYITQGVYFDRESFVYLLSPEVAKIFASMFAYLGWGLLYISIMFNEVVMSSLNCLVSFLLPYGFVYVYGEGLPEIMTNVVANKLMIDKLYVLIKWVPNYVLFVNTLGGGMTLLLCFFLGNITKLLANVPDNLSSKYMTEYMIMLLMISMPMGAFVNSSAHKITCLILCIYWMWYILHLKLKLTIAFKKSKLHNR